MNAVSFLAPSQWFSPVGGPRYVQLRKRIADGIEKNVLLPGSSLPAEREIAAITGLSRVTVRKAILSLVREGAIVQKHGSGSFVSTQKKRIEQPLSRLTSFTEDMKRRGMATSSRWLERGIFIPSPDEIVALALSPDASISRLSRIRDANANPMAIEMAVLPVAILPDPVNIQTSLYEILETRGFRPVRAIQKICAINLTNEQSQLLDVPKNHAGLKIERTSYLADGQPVELTQSIYRGDAYNFVAELRIARE